jgi:DNA-binding MarR family transcriptional regulator
MISEMPRPRVNDMAEMLAMDQTSLSRTLRLMERDGVIAAVAGDDKRESRWVLGRRGQQLLKRAMPAWRGAQKSVEKLLGPDAHRVRSAAYDLSTRLSN